jgi:hypothetical protein
MSIQGRFPYVVYLHSTQKLAICQNQWHTKKNDIPCFDRLGVFRVGWSIQKGNRVKTWAIIMDSESVSQPSFLYLFFPPWV